MESQEFVTIRKNLNKTQKQMAQLLGISVKAIRSYEQGWRSIPAHVERQLLFLMTRNNKKKEPCWDVNECPDDKKEQCPAWEFNAGEFCWHINGTICNGEAHENWQEKIKVCKKCDVLLSSLK